MLAQATSTSLDNIFSNIDNTGLKNAYMNNGLESKITMLETKAKYAAIESDLPTQFEMANVLKNYATVNTAEPIQTQVSYNLGSENIENGRDGETLNNTEMQLEDSSVITEIENQGLDLYDLGRGNVTNFDIDMLNTESLLPDLYNTPETDKNVKIISVQNIPPPVTTGSDKSVNEISDLFDNIPSYNSNWETDVINAFGQLSNEPPITEPQQQPFPYYNEPANVLKDLTADADICRCEDCKCTPYDNCHGCNVNEPKQGCCSTESGKETKKCGCNAISAAQLPEVDNNNDQCCVVVCLKTIKQLKDMLQLAGCLNGNKDHASFNVGDITFNCVKSNALDICKVHK